MKLTWQLKIPATKMKRTKLFFASLLLPAAFHIASAQELKLNEP
jgi:hypothetical protein